VRVTSTRIRLTAIALGCALLGSSLSDRSQNLSASWPFNHIAALSFGLELILIGALFTLISRWVVTGDFHQVRVLILDEVQRYLREIRKLRQRGVYVFSNILRLAHVRTRILLDALMNSELRRSNSDLLTAFGNCFPSASSDITDVCGGSERFMPAWCASPKVRPPMQVSF
jgi:hypothetical protein